MSASPEAAGVSRSAQRRVRHALDLLAQGRPPALVLVFALAVAVRSVPLLRTGGLTGVLGVEDGVAYSASAHLLRGMLPYSDVALDQPPGLAVLLLPVTALGILTGDPVALAVARIGIVLLGGASAVLVALLVRRHAPAYAVPAGLLYAAWRLPAASERTVGTEPFLAVGLLLALLLVGTGRRPRRAAASGAVLGLTTAVTLWALPAVVLFPGHLLLRRQRRAAGIWAGGALAGLAALAGPFVVLAPAAFVEQAVRSQLLGAAEVTASERFRRFADVARLGGYDVPATIEVMLATCVIVALVVASVAAWGQPEARLATLLVLSQCALVITASDHRFERFAVAPTLVVVLVTALHRLAPRPWAGRTGRIAGAAGVVLLAGVALSGVHNVVPRPSGVDRLRDFVTGRTCVWFDTASTAVAADGLSAQLDRGCPVPVDRLADVLAEVGVDRAAATGDLAHEARHTASYQRVVRAELARADAAVLPVGTDQGVLGDAARAALAREFTEVARYPTVTAWARRR